MNCKKILFVLLLFGVNFYGFAQQANVKIEQDSRIPHLLKLKTELSQDNKMGDRYKIQIYSGNNGEANTVIKEFRSEYSQWSSTIEYETPNYKVWVGNFRNSLEADRALILIKEHFPAAFRFRPGRK